MSDVTVLTMCGSQRNLSGGIVKCNRKYGHPATQDHRAVLENGTVLLWEGAESVVIIPRQRDQQ